MIVQYIYSLACAFTHHCGFAGAFTKLALQDDDVRRHTCKTVPESPWICPRPACSRKEVRLTSDEHQKSVGARALPRSHQVSRAQGISKILARKFRRIFICRATVFGSKRLSSRELDP